MLDPSAGEPQERSWQVLKKGGILVSLLSPSVVERAKAHGVRGAWFIAEPSAEQPGLRMSASSQSAPAA